MTIGGDYSTPVTVNGFLCKNCTDVDYAKKHIDPEHPKSGPYGINAKDDPSAKQTTASVTFGGALSKLGTGQPQMGASNVSNIVSGGQLDISV